MSTIYLNDTSKPIRPPHSNDCNGHNTSISVGGNGQLDCKAKIYRIIKQFFKTILL